jgi:hypothetical protein
LPHALADKADEHYIKKATDFYAETLKRRKRIGFQA